MIDDLLVVVDQLKHFFTKVKSICTVFFRNFVKQAENVRMQLFSLKNAVDR